MTVANSWPRFCLLLCICILGCSGSSAFTSHHHPGHRMADRQTKGLSFSSFRVFQVTKDSKSFVTILSASQGNSNDQEKQQVDESSATTIVEERPSIHPATIDALTEALVLRAENKTNTMPLRLYADVEPFDIMMTAGKIAQLAVRNAARDFDLQQEEEQVIGGRIVAIINRFEELEEQLVSKAAGIDIEEKQQRQWFGVVSEEINNVDSLSEHELQTKLDEEIREEPALAKSRAECLLALFLELVEGPGLRANNVVVPCMDVDFMDDNRFEALFKKVEEPTKEDHQSNMEKLQDELAKIETLEKEQEEEQDQVGEESPVEASKRIGDPLREANGVRPSLHPLTINIISEALRVRARNDTAAPLRLLNDDMEGWEIHYQAGKLTEQFIRQRQATSDQDGMKLTEEECSVIGGRVVGIVMRLEDLEWELVHRCKQEAWIAKYNEWDNFGILKDESCIRSLDERILSDPLFTVNRAERLLAIFLLNLEGPGVKAAGDSLPGGSDVDFLEEDHYKIMQPRT